jgi:hypothetical protein
MCNTIIATYLMLKEVLCSYVYLKYQSFILRSNGYFFFHIPPPTSSHICAIFSLAPPLVLAIRSKMDDCDFKCIYEHNISLNTEYVAHYYIETDD